MTTIVQLLSTSQGEIAAGRVAASNEASARFFGAHADRIAAACQALAHRFQRAGRLLVQGDALQRSDVSHAVVEFLHPVIVGKRSLPALALPSAAPADGDDALRTLGRPDDILLVVAGVVSTARDEVMLRAARDQGMLTVLLTGQDSCRAAALADFHFGVPSSDPCVVQETHEMLYHVLWELVHVFLEHRPVRA